jgi:hypothetical protein
MKGEEECQGLDKRWQREAVVQAIAEANAGDFASDAEVREVFRKLRRRGDSRTATRRRLPPKRGD